MRFEIEHLGDTAALVTVGEDASDVTLARVRAVTGALTASPPEGLVETVPGFRTVAVHYDPLKIDFDRFRSQLDSLLADVSGAKAPEAREMEIPVCYGGDLGPDLEFVATHNAMTEDEVIATHQKRSYLVHMIGFAPGFAYLGGMSERIATPRRDSPRTSIPAGSVGIAGSQTGIYPIDTPGGWQLIGRTPIPLFRPQGSEPSLLRAGDRVRFVAIERAEYDATVGAPG